MRGTDSRIVLGLHRSRHERSLLTNALDLGVTALDTSSNYLGFRSHRILAQNAGDLLPKFTVSTKVGYFRGARGTEHTLDPVRLQEAVERAVQDLGREPDVVFLHNPEHSLHEAVLNNRDTLTRACCVLDHVAGRGLCGAWGIASWDPTILPSLIDTTAPRPSLLMIRAGLLSGIRTLDAVDALISVWGLADGRVRGMSPFGGSTRTPVWSSFDPRIFLQSPCAASRAQAAFRVAYALPPVEQVSVGTDDPGHLAELIEALAYEVDDQAIRAYLHLLRNGMRVQSD